MQLHKCDEHLNVFYNWPKACQCCRAFALPSGNHFQAALLQFAHLRTFAPIVTVHLWCARYSLGTRVPRHLFQARSASQTQQNIELMDSALTWCANIFVGCSVTPTFFRQITSFLILSIILKSKKKSVRKKF